MRDEAKSPPAGEKPSREPLGAEVIDLTAQCLRVLAEPSRIALLEALNAGEAGVQELADAVGLPHQNVSAHLAVLHRAGILRRRPKGAGTRYSLDDWSAWWVVEQIARWVKSGQRDDEGEQGGG